MPVRHSVKSCHYDVIGHSHFIIANQVMLLVSFDDVSAMSYGCRHSIVDPVSGTSKAIHATVSTRSVASARSRSRGPHCLPRPRRRHVCSCTSDCYYYHMIAGAVALVPLIDSATSCVWDIILSPRYYIAAIVAW